MLLTCDSSMSNDASIFCSLYSNSIRRDSQEWQNVFKTDTVFIMKLFMKAIVRFCCIGKIYSEKIKTQLESAFINNKKNILAVLQTKLTFV